MNQSIFNFLHSLAGQFILIDRLIIFLAQTLPWLAVLGLAVYVLVHWRQSGAIANALFLATAPIIAWSLSTLIKTFELLERPFLVFPEGSTLLSNISSSAFPSSHATFFFSLAFAIYVIYGKKLGSFYLIIAILISLARVASGLHWPIDILGGFFLALIVVGLLQLAFGQRRSRALA